MSLPASPAAGGDVRNADFFHLCGGYLPAVSNMKSILDSVKPAPLLVASATLNEDFSSASKPVGGAAGVLFSVTVTLSATVF